MGGDLRFRVLPILALSGGLAGRWNRSAPLGQRISPGDFILEVNGAWGDLPGIINHCKSDNVLCMTLARSVPDSETIMMLHRRRYSQRRPTHEGAYGTRLKGLHIVSD